MGVRIERINYELCGERGAFAATESFNISCFFCQCTRKAKMDACM